MSADSVQLCVESFLLGKNLYQGKLLCIKVHCYYTAELS